MKIKLAVALAWGLPCWPKVRPWLLHPLARWRASAFWCI